MPDVPPGDPRRTPKAPPPTEYRPTREYESADTSMRTMALAAVGIAAVVMGGVFVLQRHHPATADSVPVIEPDPTPLRVKPADPGGMKVAGADDALPDDATGVEADKLAPPPETPAPQVLQQQAKAGVMAAPPRIGAPVPLTPAQAPQQVALPPVPAAPPPRLAAEPAPPQPAPAKPVLEKPGAVAVQVAALDSQDSAQAEWDRLARKLPAAFAGHRPDISRTERDGKIFYRLRVAGFADIAAATEFCARLRAGGMSCTLARF